MARLPPIIDCIVLSDLLHSTTEYPGLSVAKDYRSIPSDPKGLTNISSEMFVGDAYGGAPRHPFETRSAARTCASGIGLVVEDSRIIWPRAPYGRRPRLRHPRLPRNAYAIESPVSGIRSRGRLSLKGKSER